MPRFRPYDNTQTVMIPISLDDQMQPGSLEHTLNYIINKEINLKTFCKRYNNEVTGRKAYHPSVLLKIIIYAYSKGIITSRKIEQNCKTNVTFMALSSMNSPDHSTIAHFVSSMKDDIDAIFIQVLMICDAMNLLGGDLFAIDGCKISSNASKEWSGTFSDLNKKKEKLAKLAKKITQSHIKNDKGKSITEEIQKDMLRAKRLRKESRKIAKFLKENDKRDGKRGREKNSNITDNESAKIKSSHGVIQGYNGLAAVDSKKQVIVSCEAFGESQEGQFFKTMVNSAKKNIKRAKIKNGTSSHKTYLADTNYFSEENLKFAAKSKIIAIIPDPQFRKRDPNFADRDRFRKTKGKFTKDDFTFDKKVKSYICPNGSILKPSGRITLNTNSGYKYQSNAGDCKKCSLKNRCISKKNGTKRTLYIVDSKKINYSERMKRLIDNENIRKLYSRRMAIVEPVFSHITYCKNMNRFTLRGKEKVNTQWLLYCITHNISKIAKARENNCKK